MPTKIAHLSDLHYGGGFDLALWRSVENAVRTFDPELLIVSGDLVDDPREDHLRAAKHTLEQLAAAVGAQLFVVPGNHDLYFSGLEFDRGRSGWFAHIFNGAGGPEPAAIAAAITEPTGFRRNTRGLGGLVDRAAVFFGVGRHATPAPAAPAPRPEGTCPPMLREPENTGILLALIDSNNVAGQAIRLATGCVSDDDLVALDTELQNMRTGHLARIAVIHHHVLPVAHTAGNIVGAEPFMVLHNAGDVISLLARHRFDLVLHGHKHRSQFARIDFSPDTPGGYPIAVAAAGSAALLRPNEPQANSFNLIIVQDNGRIEVQSLHYGAGVAPNLQGPIGIHRRVFKETIESTKRRAFIRAFERHPIYCQSRELNFDVSELGHLVIEHHTIGLRCLRGTEEYRERTHIVRIPPCGRLAFDLRLDAASVGKGYRVDARAGAVDGRRVVRLPHPLSDEPASYVVSYAFANCIAMTRWEAEERARADEQVSGNHRPDDWDQEGVSFYVGHPVEEVVFRLQFPGNLASANPYVRCERRRDFPEFVIDASGDAQLPPDAVFDIDTEMQSEEQRNLLFDPADGRWHLRIRHPAVGYRYRLIWQAPGQIPDEPIPGQTLQWRRLLLAMADRPAPSVQDVRAKHVFDVLAGEFAKLLSWQGTDEIYTVELFVYDTAHLGVRPVLGHTSGPEAADWRKFLIPLGDGIAGAAFQQRSVLPWAKNTSRSLFTKPVANPLSDVEMEAILAVPVFHPAQQDEARPSPWATIGVVSFGSSSPASKVPELLNPVLSPENVEMLTILRGLAQAHVHSIINILSSPAGIDTAAGRP